MKEIRQDMQVIFQDPYASLNPRMTVMELIAESLIVNQVCKNKSEVDDRVYSIMKTVGLSPRTVNMYPHEMDGGRRQRIGIGRALVLNPKFIVCDEPVSALDVSIQAQILDLMLELRRSFNMAMLLITHDFGIVSETADRVGVMYAGKLVEENEVFALFDAPRHPYTRMLMRALPRGTKQGGRLESIPGTLPDPTEPYRGCLFFERCPLRVGRCATEEPLLRRLGETHRVACWRAEEEEQP